jgi:alpha-tubulin suppressor-like RCC1 family protein
MTGFRNLSNDSSYYYEAHKSVIDLSKIDDEWAEQLKGGLTGVWTLSEAKGDLMEGQWKNPESQLTLPIKLKRIGTKCPDGIYTTKLHEPLTVKVAENNKGIPGLENVRDIASSAHHTCALLSDGDVKCWGMPNEKNEIVFDDKKTHDIDAMSFHGQFDDVLCLVSRDKKVSCKGDRLPIINFDNLGTSENPHVAISLMGEFVCVLGSDGRVQCAGNNKYGQLGDGGVFAERQKPVFVRDINDAKAIALSDTGGCAVLQNGHVKCWGRDIWSGEISGTVEVKGLSNVKTVAVEEQKACATLQDGKEKCWGSEPPPSGQDVQFSSELPIDNNGEVTIQTGYETQCELGKDKRVMCGSVIVSGLSDVIKLTGTPVQVCTLLSNGHVRCWNPEQFSKAGITAGESGPVVFDGEPQSKAPQLIGANDHSLNGVWRGQVGFDVERYVKNIILCLSSSEQSVYHDLHDRTEISLDRHDASWAEKKNGQLIAEWKLTKVLGDHIDGVRTDTSQSLYNQENFSLDRIRVWPGGKTPTCNSEAYKPQKPALSSDNGQRSAEYAIATDGNCLVLNTGKMKCWGAGNIPPDINNARSVAGNCILLQNGTVKCWENDESGLLKPALVVPGVDNATSLVGGNGFNCALIRDGKVKCWGSNYYGQLGNGHQTSDGQQVKIVSNFIGLEKVVGLSATRDNTCAVLSDGGVWCWGNVEADPMRGDKGQDANHYQPVKIRGIAGAISVASGGYFDCAILTDHSVKCWDDIDQGWHPRDKVGMIKEGLSWNGEDVAQAISEGASQVHNTMSLSAGDNYVCALLQGGTVECWGKNSDGELGDGTAFDSTKPVKVVGVADATALVTDYMHSCVLIRDGSVKCWGRPPLGDGVAWPWFNTAVNVRLH